MTKINYKHKLNEIYYTVFNNNVQKVRLVTVTLSSKNETIYNNRILESKIFTSERIARRYLLKNYAKRIKLIDKTNEN